MATRNTKTTVTQRKGKCVYAKLSDINTTESHRIGTETLGDNKFTKKFFQKSIHVQLDPQE